MASEITLVAVFIAGILSFLSPCVLPLVPAFLTYLGSVGLKEGEKASRVRIFLNAVAYVLGFTVVFALLGVLLNSVLAGTAYETRLWLSRAGGAIIILFGLYMIGILKLDFLQGDHRLKPSGSGTKSAYLFSFLFGATFAVGWSPCVGAILGTVLTLAVTAPGQSFLLLLVYSLGLGVPFLIAGAFVAQARELIKKAGPWLQYFNYFAGALLILLGILVFTQTLPLIANFGPVQSFIGGS
jgi:cytochrome c-type biogenesis protein